MQQDGAPDVRRGKARPAGDHAVIDRDGANMVAAVDPHCGQTQPQAPVLGMKLRAASKGGLGGARIPRSVLGHRQGVEAFGMAGIELYRAGEVWDRLARLSPSQQPRAEHAVSIGAVRRGFDCLSVGDQGLIVAPAQLVGHPDQHPRSSRMRQPVGRLDEGLPSPVRTIGGEFHLPQLEPQAGGGLDVALVGSGEGLAVVAGGELIGAIVGRSASAAEGAGTTDHDEGGGGERESAMTGERSSLVPPPRPAATTWAGPGLRHDRVPVGRDLTTRTAASTMPSMDRETLGSILEQADGTEAGKPSRYGVKEGHRVSIYLGEIGQAMVVSDIVSCALEEKFVMVETKDSRRVLYVPYETVQAIADEPPRTRTGFA